MQAVLTVDEIRRLEERAKQLGLTERSLIENASSRLADTIVNLDLGTKVLVVAGRGNNGADALACARKLLSRGYDVIIALIADKPINEEVGFQKSVLEKLNQPIYAITSDNLPDLVRLTIDRDFIIDGIFGIGVINPVSPFLQEVITQLNLSSIPIIACDVPSGLCPQTGVVLGQAIKAKYTVTFLGAKPGFLICPGSEHCGEVIVVDIGVSREMIERATGDGR
jgi:NAD(P)H-hydrate epimerase